MESKVSIILPVYNGARYVGTAIRSILNQSHKNFELIIVNDCSTDNTQAVLSDFAKQDSRIKVIENKTNQKLPRALNIGFAAATGKYLTWTSDDNQYHKDAIYVMASVLDSHDNVDLVYTNFTMVDMTGEIIKEVIEPEPKEIKYGDNIGACFLYRRTLADKAGEYNPDMFLAEDYEFFIRCYKYGQFYHIDEDYYDYGRHEKSLSVLRRKDIAHQAFKAMMTHFEFLLSICETQSEKNKFYYTLLGLLSDKKEYKRIRGKIYASDYAFACRDFLKRVKNKFLNCFVGFGD